MTITQEVPANSFPPFPFFVENPVDPQPNVLREGNNHHANSTSGHTPDPLPDRCQFTFSDGRQCTMPRSEIHPLLCRFHAEREDQLFGDPAPSGVVGAGLDLPELYSACRDLTTAAGVNRALGQVFRLLAQRRISRQEAATFCHLAQLLLRSIAAMRAERVEAQCSGESHSACAGLSLSESASTSESATLTKAVIPSPPPAARFAAAARPATHLSAVWRTPAFTPADRSAQIARNEDLSKLGSQPMRNEHLQNCET
jgi:hypothetical protein